MGLGYSMATLQLSAVESPVWDAVESINRAIQKVYGLPERSATLTVYVPKDSAIRIAAQGEDRLVIEAIGALGDRRYRILDADAWNILDERATRLTSDGRLTVTYGRPPELPITLSGREVVLGPGRHTIVLKNINGYALQILVVERGLPTEVITR
ncbi:MAG: hypothetical protein ABDH63_02810 [Candidatus Caldarchaeales archaeon]